MALLSRKGRMMVHPFSTRGARSHYVSQSWLPLQLSIPKGSMTILPPGLWTAESHAFGSKRSRMGMSNKNNGGKPNEKKATAFFRQRSPLKEKTHKYINIYIYMYISIYMRCVNWKSGYDLIIHEPNTRLKWIQTCFMGDVATPPPPPPVTSL